ncbi:hypothetical protein I2I05_13180 [Hymenobacter sp. BT683]|uniref:Uncharacterized protein n=1 Tax=Hymenobacter jeongseonensis TaxID=2791027 RepID=A0ABS0IIZ9_9BACT|nr:hypothetical protein [Hymenobacter jeongseonensis]MBF9238352.1 hypothetical protein [Hymenobacter jeongseonensis]
MKIRYFSLLLLLCVLTGTFSLRAQKRPLLPPPNAPAQTARTELPLTATESEVHVQALPADSTVVLLVGRIRSLSNESSFSFQQYDHALHLRQETPLEVPDEFEFNRMCAEGNTVYALFSSRSKTGRLWVAAYNGQLGQTRTQQYETRLSREIVELKALDGRLLATVLLNDQQHVTVLLLDVANGQMQYLSSIYEPMPTQLTSVADAASRRAEYVLTQTNGRKSRLLLKQLTEQGQLVSSEFVQTESERSLITAQITPPQDTTARLLMGTYSLRDPNYAQGLFATDLRASANSGTKPPLRFYDFLRLKHFFDYLKPSRQARLRERTERRMARSVPPLRWRYRVLLHELRPQPDGGYVLVAEVYYPHYRYNSYGNVPGNFNTGYSPYGSGYANSRVFDGYQTTHALVCGFDRSGTLLWDNTFVVNNLRRYSLEEAVRLQNLPDGRLVLAYLDDDKIRYKLINRAETSPNDHAVPILTGTGTDGGKENARDTSQSDLMPWFGSRFIATGYQRVRSERGPDREVFFLNSVVF